MRILFYGTFCLTVVILFLSMHFCFVFFFFQAEDGIRDVAVTGVQTCALPICSTVRVTRRARVSGLLAESIQRIQSRRPMGVRSFHNVFASWESVRATGRSAGAVGSGAGPQIKRFTLSPAPAPAPPRMAVVTRRPWRPGGVGCCPPRN